MTIKEFFYRRHRRHLPDRQAVWPDWNQVQKVFILYDSDWMEKNTEIRDIQRCLQQDGKQVVAWGILHNKEVTSPILPASRIIGRKQINLLDKPHKEVLSDLSAQPYDIVLDLTQHDTILSRYLLCHVSAPFKAGILKQEGLLDFMVDMPAKEDPTPLYQQIIHYLTTIAPHQK